MDKFKEASRLKLRFITVIGLASVEQLWEMSQTNLATAVRAQKKVLGKSEDDELSFLGSGTTTTDKTEELRFEILKEVYMTKQQEAEDRKNAKDAKEQRNKILDLIAEKKEGALKEKSIEELEAMIK